MNTTALPTGWPHEETGLVVDDWARSSLPPTDWISRPSRSARSPRGFHSKGPGVGAEKTHVAVSPVGSSTQALPSATNATVCERARDPVGHPAGRGWPFASVVTVGERVGPSDPVVPVEGDEGGVGEVPVHAPSVTSAPATSSAVVARTVLMRLRAYSRPIGEPTPAMRAA